MAINQNHLFEELNGVKCAIVEKNVAAPRVEFLRKLLEHNGYTVVVIGAPPGAETFTVGVTDVMFNPINAIFGRLLKAPGGHIVTLAYWKQQEAQPDDERPYFEK